VGEELLRGSLVVGLLFELFDWFDLLVFSRSDAADNDHFRAPNEPRRPASTPRHELSATEFRERFEDADDICANECPAIVVEISKRAIDGGLRLVTLTLRAMIEELARRTVGLVQLAKLVNVGSVWYVLS
jgi:hypothetical protein